MPWPKHLQVDKRIVLLLSSATYESFPKALREVVSNAYDADATKVTINVSLADDRITIEDNGSGMTSDEFDFFLRIAGKGYGRQRQTRLGRTRIGQFGVGFLAVFPFCETIEVESTVLNSSASFRATIPSARFTAEADIPEDITTADVNGMEFRSPELTSLHYTRITLTGLTYLTRRYFSSVQEAKRGTVNSVRGWSGLDRLKWELAETLPVHFGRNSQLNRAFPEESALAVVLNDDPILRNDYTEELLESGADAAGNVRFNYAIGTPWKAIHPYEARGLKVRLHGVGVGDRSYFDLQIAGRTFSRLHWLTGEVHVTSGLDESIAVTRDSFTNTEAYDDFREFFREHLRRLAYRIEEIDVSRRQIEKLAKVDETLTDGRLELIERQAKELEQRGFRVEIVDDAREDSKPATVNLVDRLVTIRPNHPSFVETLTVAGSTYPVTYSTWDFRGVKYAACRFTSAGSIEINRDYPGFRSVNFREVLQKLQVILLLAERSAHDKDDLFRQIQEGLLTEFMRGSA